MLGQLLNVIIEGLDSGTESLGWLLMYLVCAIKFDTGCNIVDALMEGENGSEKQNDYINCSSVHDNAIICLWRKLGRYSPFVRAGSDAE